MGGINSIGKMVTSAVDYTATAVKHITKGGVMELGSKYTETHVPDSFTKAVANTIEKVSNIVNPGKLTLGEKIKYNTQGHAAEIGSESASKFMEWIGKFHK